MVNLEHKVNDGITRVYKPEISRCLFCDSKLMYRYTVSNKVIQFSGGNCSRVKNLGYSCSNPDCPHPQIIYTSLTAAKLCIKGYTYSAKVLATISYYKRKHLSRDEICDKLVEAGIEISDRNIDIIYDKYKEKLDMDYKSNIEVEYNYMLREYGKIFLSIDAITIEDNAKLVSVRNFFTGNQIGLHLFDETCDSDYDFLNDYLDNDNIGIIATVRKQTGFFPKLEKRIRGDVKFIHYLKY